MEKIRKEKEDNPIFLFESRKIHFVTLLTLQIERLKTTQL